MSLCTSSSSRRKGPCEQRRLLIDTKPKHRTQQPPQQEIESITQFHELLSSFLSNSDSSLSPRTSTSTLSISGSDISNPTSARTDTTTLSTSTSTATEDAISADAVSTASLVSCLSMSGWVFDMVDFSLEPLCDWNLYNISGAEFLGCTFPLGVTSAEVRARGGIVWENHPNVPFLSLRHSMYRQDELQRCDAQIYEYYLKKRTLDKTLAEAVHDHFMFDALTHYLRNKTPIGVMGGHRLSRTSQEYAKIVHFCRKLVLSGFLVVTGGGPGAMEAANLGAYLANKTDDQVELALKIIAQGNESFEGLEYLNQKSAENVISTLGSPDFMPSVGVPTYRYGHEPSNKFATWHAKFFSNAIREDGLLSISRGGLVYVIGGAGTRQEIFQAACHNTYCKTPETRPQVLVGKEFWTNNGVWSSLEVNAVDCDFKKYLLLTDDFEEILQHLISHATEKGLPLNKIL